MSSLGWMIFIMVLLTVLGTFTLILITYKFYWGDIGAPPPKKKSHVSDEKHGTNINNH